MTDRPFYTASIQHDEGWLLAEVTGCNDTANPDVVGYVTQAKTIDEMEFAVRELIATFLECDMDAFDVRVVAA